MENLKLLYTGKTKNVYDILYNIFLKKSIFLSYIIHTAPRPGIIFH